MRSTMAERVQQGLALLKQEDVDNINLSDITMSSQDYCVLGLVYGSYYEGLTELDLKANSFASIEHGFCIDWREPGGFAANWQRLTKEWQKAIIKQRREQRRKDNA